MTQQYQEVRQRVLEAVNRKSVAAPVQKEPGKKAFMTRFLGGCIFILSLAIVLVICGKAQNKIETGDRPSINAPDRVDEVAAANGMASKGDLQAIKTDISNLKGKVDALEQTTQTWAQRIWLLVIANNENANINQTANAQQGIADSGYITFDHDWRINHPPKTITLDQESMERLKPLVK